MTAVSYSDPTMTTPNTAKPRPVTRQRVAGIIRRAHLGEARTTGPIRHRNHDGLTVIKHGHHFAALLGMADEVVAALPHLAAAGLRAWHPTTHAEVPADATEADIPGGCVIVTA